MVGSSEYSPKGPAVFSGSSSFSIIDLTKRERSRKSLSTIRVKKIGIVLLKKTVD